MSAFNPAVAQAALHRPTQAGAPLALTGQALRALPQLADALVVERAERPVGLRLVAYLLAHPGQAVPAALIHQQLQRTLAPELVPSTFITLDAFPLRPDGSIDLAALPAPDSATLAARQYEPPQGPLERAIASVWQGLLGLDHVGRHDHFFELGGHSSLGLQLVHRLRHAIDVEIAPRELFVHPTLRGFAQAVSARIHASRTQRAVRIRTGANGTPLFLVHANEGDIGYAEALAPYLAPEVPLYALAASGFQIGEQALSSVEEMAASYVYAMRAVQPHGPYCVAGWRGGGTIAYEIANQLIGADETVQLLGLIDTPSCHPWPSSPAPDGAAGIGVAAGFEQWLGQLDWLEAAPPLRAALAALMQADGVDALLLRCQALGLLAPDAALPRLKRELAVRHALALALSHYARPAIPVPLDLFAARADGDATLGWHGVAGPHLHTALLDGAAAERMHAPHIAQLASALDAALQRASAAPLACPESAYAARVTIQRGSSLVRPLFCVPGAGAGIDTFTALAAALDPALPVHGLQPRGLCGTLVPHIDVPSAARAYLTQLRQTQARGPYRLLGHAFGGWVAYDMARALTAEGEQVDTLIVLDAEAPATPGYAFSRVSMLLQLIGLFELNGATTLGIGAAELAARDHEAQLALLLERLLERQLMPPDTGIGALRALVRVFSSNLNAPYVPHGTYPGPLQLVLAPERAGGVAQLEQLAARWRVHAPQTRLWPASGNHVSLLAPPHVEALARYLGTLLEENR